MLLSDVVDRLVLRDLHAGAHVTLTMQEEGERAREVLTAAEKTQREKKTNKKERMSFHALLYLCVQKRAIITKSAESVWHISVFQAHQEQQNIGDIT